MLHVGFIGGGNITETHIRAAQALPDLGISAVFGTNIKKIAALAQKYGAAAYSDFDEFLAHQAMDLAIIGSPSGLHAMHGIAAAERGLHVLVEKPLDVSTERADALIRAADGAGVKLGVIFQDRLKPDVLRLREWIRLGQLGRPILVEASVKWYRPAEYYRDSKWRGTLALDGGGVRGLSSLLILEKLMQEIQRLNGERQPPIPCKYFDMICGTSTGGLIAIMLGRLRMVCELRFQKTECYSLSKNLSRIHKALKACFQSRQCQIRSSTCRSKPLSIR